ncbi:hypothetical protein D3C76_1445600 [compost metagenome]
MLAGQEDFAGTQGSAESGVARITGALFDAGAGGDLHTDDLQFDAQIVAQALAMIRPGISRSLQAVVDVNGAQWRQGLLAGQGCQQVQEDGGVEAAGEGDAPGGGGEPGGQP